MCGIIHGHDGRRDTRTWPRSYGFFFKKKCFCQKCWKTMSNSSSIINIRNHPNKSVSSQSELSNRAVPWPGCADHSFWLIGNRLSIMLMSIAPVNQEGICCSAEFMFFSYSSYLLSVFFIVKMTEKWKDWQARALQFIKHSLVHRHSLVTLLDTPVELIDNVNIK